MALRGYDKLYAGMGPTELIKAREDLLRDWERTEGPSASRIRDKVHKVEKALKAKSVPEKEWQEEEADIEW